MKAVSVRTLQSQLKRVLARVERGETIEVTRRKKRVARLVPVPPEAEIEPWPDMAAWRKKIYGGRRLDVREVLEYERGRW